LRSVRNIFSRDQVRPWIEALLAGILFQAVAVCLKLFFSFWVSMERAPFLLFFGAVVCAGWIGGLRAGLIARAVSAILADFLFIPPFGSLFLPNPSDAFGVITFVLEATLISFLATFRDRARRTAEEASKRDESLTSQLRSEQQVAAAATRELESSRERIAILAATTADGIWDYDYDADQAWWSDRAFQLLGYLPGKFELTLERLDSAFGSGWPDSRGSHHRLRASRRSSKGAAGRIPDAHFKTNQFSGARGEHAIARRNVGKRDNQDISALKLQTSREPEAHFPSSDF
jgi:PAS domain-containing protein